MIHPPDTERLRPHLLAAQHDARDRRPGDGHPRRDRRLDARRLDGVAIPGEGVAGDLEAEGERGEAERGEVGPLLRAVPTRPGDQREVDRRLDDEHRRAPVVERLEGTPRARVQMGRRSVRRRGIGAVDRREQCAREELEAEVGVQRERGGGEERLGAIHPSIVIVLSRTTFDQAYCARSISFLLLHVSLAFFVGHQAPLCFNHGLRPARIHGSSAG